MDLKLLISVKRREDTTHKDIAAYLSRLKITKDLANFVSYSSNVCKIYCVPLYSAAKPAASEQKTGKIR